MYQCLYCVRACERGQQNNAPRMLNARVCVCVCERETQAMHRPPTLPASTRIAIVRFSRVAFSPAHGRVHSLAPASLVNVTCLTALGSLLHRLPATVFIQLIQSTLLGLLHTASNYNRDLRFDVTHDIRPIGDENRCVL